jgi:integrase
MRILRAAFDAGLIERLPRRGRRLKGQPNRKTAKISLAEFEAFFAGIGDAKLSIARRGSSGRGRSSGPEAADWARAFWGTIFFSALRRANVLALRWEQFTGESLDVRQFKTGGLVSIPLHPAWRRLLEPLPGAFTAGPVFVISHKTLYRDQRAIAGVSGTGRVTPQSVRRLAARCYERAHAGAGRLILGRPFPGADGHYLDAPEILQWASEKLPVPEILRTDEERDLTRTQEQSLVDGFRSLREADRDSVLRLVAALGRPGG